MDFADANSNAEKLDVVIADLLTHLNGSEGNTDEYTTVTDNLVKLAKIRNDSLKLEEDINFEAEKIAIDKEKIEIDKEKLKIDQRKVTLDADKISLEGEKLIDDRQKINIEQDRLDIEKNRIDIEEKKLALETEKVRSWRPSNDAIVTAAASVLSILAILHYEKAGVITSKALSFVGRTK